MSIKSKGIRRGEKARCMSLRVFYRENISWDEYRDLEVYHGMNMNGVSGIYIMTYFLTLAY